MFRWRKYPELPVIESAFIASNSRTKMNIKFTTFTFQNLWSPWSGIYKSCLEDSALESGAPLLLNYLTFQL